MLETKALLEQKAASLTARADTVDDLQTERREMEKTIEGFRKSQAKLVELERTNKKLQVRESLFVFTHPMCMCVHVEHCISTKWWCFFIEGLLCVSTVRNVSYTVQVLLCIVHVHVKLSNSLNDGNTVNQHQCQCICIVLYIHVHDIYSHSDLQFMHTHTPTHTHTHPSRNRHILIGVKAFVSKRSYRCTRHVQRDSVSCSRP